MGLVVLAVADVGDTRVSSTWVSSTWVSSTWISSGFKTHAVGGAAFATGVKSSGNSTSPFDERAKIQKEFERLSVGVATVDEEDGLSSSDTKGSSSQVANERERFIAVTTAQRSSRAVNTRANKNHVACRVAIALRALRSLP